MLYCTPNIQAPQGCNEASSATVRTHK